MKKGKGDKSEIKQQLIGAKCFVKYCQAIGKEFWNQPNFLDNYEYRLISIARVNLDQRKTRYSPKDQGQSSPIDLNKIRKFKWQNCFPWNQLIQD